MNEPKIFRAIMLSSTFTDLKEHRQRAIEAIAKFDYMQRVMEYSGARADADVIQTSLQMVRDAAAYVGIIGFKYGQTPVDPERNPNGLSITELEFDEAMRLKRPIVLFIMGEEHSVKKTDIETHLEKLRKLNDFRERAKRMRADGQVQRVYETFDSLEQFSTAAALAIGNLVRGIDLSEHQHEAEETENVRTEPAEPSPAQGAGGTPRRKKPFSVMLSSNFPELVEHQHAVREAMVTYRLSPITATDDVPLLERDPIGASLNKVDEADAYVGFVSYRYGKVFDDSQRNPDGLSLTELEFACATARKIPICMFIMHDDHPVPRSAVGAEIGSQEKYQRFVSQAKRDCVYAEFKSVEDLKTKTVQSFAELRRLLEKPEPADADVDLKLPSKPIASVEELNFPYDHVERSRWPCHGASVNDLNLELVRAFASKVAPQLVEGQVRDETLVQRLGLLPSVSAGGQPVPHNAAILCFSDAPERFVPQARASFVAGEENADGFIYQKVYGPLQHQVTTLVQLTLSVLRTSASFDREGRRVEITEIPPDVIREAISNAISHRDYSQTGTVLVEVKREAVEITNPGSFPAVFSWDSFLESDGVSSPNDAVIAYFLTIQLAFEGIGRGFRIFREYRNKNGLEAIEFEEKPGPAVRVRIKRPQKVISATVRTEVISNIPISVPRQFLGREEDLAALENALKAKTGRAAITALHGLRGVGKTTLAAAYAERHRNDYRAIWWIRAETDSTIRADLMGLGVQLGWVAADAPEQQAAGAIIDRLHAEGGGILLIYDSAVSSRNIESFLPRRGGSHSIITSNAPDWGGVATSVVIEVWPQEIGADFLTARTGREAERDAALTLSEALGGLPLAHEQAAAYCERVGIPFVDYLKRLEVAPTNMLDDTRHASLEYHGGRTVAKTFALAIEEAGKLHPGAEPLITYAALMVPEPIPLFLFGEALESFDGPLASFISDDGLDEAVGVLRAFALADRESISDERDPSVVTECIRLHRTVREVAAGRTDARDKIRRELTAAVAVVYPSLLLDNPAAWPRARRLDAIAMGLVADGEPIPVGLEDTTSLILDRLATYRQSALADYSSARPLFERALALNEKVHGPNHPRTAVALDHLGYLMRVEGDLVGARPYFERALSIQLSALGTENRYTAESLNNLGLLLVEQGDLSGARTHLEDALAIYEKALGPDHPDTAKGLTNLGHLLGAQRDLGAARQYYERALAIYEKALGPDHLRTAASLNNLGQLLNWEGDFAGALRHYERALAIYDKALGPDHPDTKIVARNTAELVGQAGLKGKMQALRQKFDLKDDK